MAQARARHLPLTELATDNVERFNLNVEDSAVFQLASEVRSPFPGLRNALSLQSSTTAKELECDGLSVNLEELAVGDDVQLPNFPLKLRN
jgi:hypothetical protein